MKNLNQKNVKSVSNLKSFFTRTCKKDNAVFLNAFEMSDEKFANEACKLFKIQPASTILQTAKNILNEVQNGKSEKKNNSKSPSAVSRNKSKKESKVDSAKSQNSVEAPKPNTENSSKSLGLKVDPDIEKLIPTANKKQYALIKKSFEEHGFREDGDFIEILKDGTIVDGHTRYRVCKELNIEIPQSAIKMIDENIEDVIKIKNIARRHLPDLKKIELVKKEWSEIEKKFGNGRKGREQKAKLTGISESSVQRFDFLKKYDPERYEAVENDEEDFNPALQDTKKKVAAIRKTKPELLVKVEGGELHIDEAYEQVKPKKPKKEKKDPVYVEMLELKEFATRMVKKYNKNKFAIDDNPEGRALKEVFTWIDNKIEKLGNS